MARSNKKTFTKDRKQKIVVSEEQLQRLLGLINEATPPKVRPPKPKDKPKDKPKPRKEFNVKKWSGPFTKKIDTFIKNKNFKGALNFLKGRLQTWQKKGSTAGPVWTQQLKQKSAVATKEKTRVEREMKKNKPKGPSKPKSITKPKPKSKPMDMKEQTQGFNCEPSSNGCNCITPIFGTGQYQSIQDCENSENCCGSGSDTDRPGGVKRICCRDERGNIVMAANVGAGNNRCPKSMTEVPCKSTPPTRPTGISEVRKLKTTHPITESDIKDMKKWFNRVNKTGTNYNPSID